MTFRDKIILLCMSCGGIEMKYSEYYITWECPKCLTLTTAKLKKDLEA